MNSATKNAHMRKIKSFNLLLSFLFFLLPLPFPFVFPLPFFSFHTLRFCHPWENYIRIYTPDSLLSCIIRLIPKFLRSPFPSLLLPFSLPFLLPFPISFPSLAFHSLIFPLALRAFDFSPPLGEIIYTPE